jgi:hypothetical protein
MDFALSWPVWMLEEFHHHPSEWCNASSGCDEDVVVFFWLAWKQESLAGWPRDKNFIANFQITEVITTEPDKEIMCIRSFFAELVNESLAGCGENIAFSIVAPGRS